MNRAGTPDSETFVHATFTDRQLAVKAVQILVDAAFPSQRVAALVRRGGAQVHELRLEHRTGVGVLAPLGMLIGCVVGPLVLTGPWHMALEGALGGGAAGALLGTLGGLGLWREVLNLPNDAFDHGSVIVGVTTEETRVESARAALTAAGAIDIQAAPKLSVLRDARTGVAHAV